jgi:hypothetical protein
MCSNHIGTIVFYKPIYVRARILATMLSKDNYSKWLGIIVADYKEG